MRDAVMSFLKNAYPVYRPIALETGHARRHGAEARVGQALHGYLKHYRAPFQPWRNKRIKLLEIGIGGHETKQGGYSLRMWKDYFPKGEIYGLDLYDKSHLQQPRITILQGDQNDRRHPQRDRHPPRAIRHHHR